MTDAQEILDNPSEASPANASLKKQESRDEMLSRHRLVDLSFISSVYMISSCLFIYLGSVC